MVLELKIKIGIIETVVLFSYFYRDLNLENRN